MGTYNPNLHAVEQDGREPIDYESLGKWLKRVRTKNGLKQEEAARHFSISRTVYTKYEKGTVKPNWEDVVKFAQTFREDVGEIRKKVSIAIPDTCALHKNRRLLHMLLEDYSKVVIPYTVKEELSSQKNSRTGEKNHLNRSAWQIMANIEYYLSEYPDRFISVDNRKYRVPESVVDLSSKNDHRMIELAKELEKDTIGDVVIITDDVDITSFYGKAILVDNYVAKRTTQVDFETISDLDREYDHLELYENYIDSLPDGALDTYLADGMTLLISCIRCNTESSLKSRGGKPIPPAKKYRKLEFLLEHGADVNKNENGHYCLSPLSHCIQVDDFRAFEILLEHGCDFNKPSMDETTARHMKASKLNEGNTPLMIACWHGRKKYVERLCSLPGICLNQQDSNGYTALIKCAVVRYNRRKKGLSCSLSELLYNHLLNAGADPLIRDRNNRTAKDWWDLADSLTENRDDD